MHRVRGLSCRRTAHVVSALIVVFVLASGAALGGDGGAGNNATAPAFSSPRFDNPSYSPDGKWMAMSDGYRDALYLYNTTDKTARQIAASPSTGYAYNWAADGTKLGFKLLVPDGQGGPPLQVPVFFDVGKQSVTALSAAVRLAGVPSFAANGCIAFTIGSELRIADGSGATIKTFPLDHYVNLAVISSNGAKVAYNDRDEHLCVLDLATGEKTYLVTDGNGYCHPVWSPDSSRLVVSTLGGRLKTVEAATGLVYELGAGSAPCWTPDGEGVFFSRVDRVDGVRVNAADICSVRFDGTGLTTLTQGVGVQATAARVAADGSKIAFVSLVDGELYEAPLVKTVAAVSGSSSTGTTGLDGGVSGYALGAAVRIDVSGASSPDSAAAIPVAQGAPITPAIETTLSRTVPYIHQVYDTPDDFNGHWACGATSAMMCISYYSRLPYWDCTCSNPYSHVSHYGRYISEIYTYNGYTYDIGSDDASGDTAWGGYGYIVRNNWKDTKGYMRDYFNNHNIPSSVDWSPTFAKLQTEVNNQYPFVLLNSLTTSGHYIATIGYVDGQYTAIFNDPYGNKNTGYMNNNGTAVRYDWPGYNNGYQNLNTVHCFIYARSTLGPTITQHPVAQNVCPGATATFAVIATGSGTLTYQWQKNAVNVSNGAHYSGATTATLSVLNADAGDTGSYRCVVSNGSGSATSNTAALTLRATTAVTQQPVDQVVCRGARATFTVVATGDGTLSYQWQKNGANLSNGGHYSGATTPTLTVTSADDADAAAYRCVIAGGCGGATSNAAVLTITAATEISQQPQSQTVEPGGSATFTVVASGEGTLNYQWQKDGADLSEGGHYTGVALSTLTVSAVGSSDEGNYRCVVTAGCGVISSAEAPLVLHVAAADFDQDGDVDLNDFSVFQMCFAGPNQPIPFPECVVVDLDGDADVDLTDFSILQTCFNGPNRPSPCL